MPYGMPQSQPRRTFLLTAAYMPSVRLGKSGLKVSKIILGCMSYGNKGWGEWVIDDQEEVTKHIKFALVEAHQYNMIVSHADHTQKSSYDHGIQTFDTADVGPERLFDPRFALMILLLVRYIPMASPRLCSAKRSGS